MSEASEQADAAAMSPVQRLIFPLVLGLLWLARHLPDRPIYRIAYTIGTGTYLIMPARRELVRRNLRRVCTWLAEEGLASPRVQRAAEDDAALERLVRAAFGHWALGYAEAALGPRYSGPELAARIVVAEPEVTRQALAPRPPGVVGPLHVGIHFGAVDLSGFYGVRVGKIRFTGPMETVEHPLARAYFDHVRNAMGATLVPLADAAPSLIAALQRGEAAGLVADRNILGRGVAVQLFGAPARLPIGPAVLSAQTGATIYLQSIVRTAPGAWLGHSVAITPDMTLPRRETTRRIVDQLVPAIERIVARAPEQWTTLFFEIWEDGGST